MSDVCKHRLANNFNYHHKLSNELKKKHVRYPEFSKADSKRDFGILQIKLYSTSLENKACQTFFVTYPPDKT